VKVGHRQAFILNPVQKWTGFFFTSEKPLPSKINFPPSEKILGKNRGMS
jgi:hypothetical protein